MNNSSYIPNKGVTAPIDPGWNDPPKLTFNTQQSTPNKPRNLLNKRVAFPLSSGITSPTVLPSLNLPPVPTLVAPTPHMPITPNRLQDDVVDSESTLHEVKSILLGQLESSGELGPKANDIKRRIGVLEEMWTNGKLNNRIFVLMRDLAHAIRDDAPSKADDIHRALMIDHVSAVSTWMPGIKQLIHHCIARSELLSIDKEE